MHPGQSPQLPFSAQRVVYFALLMGMVMFALVVAVVLQQNGGKGLADPPIPVLDTVAMFVGATSVGVAFTARSALSASIESKQGSARQLARFRSTMIQIALLEGGCLFALTAWMLNGKAVPSLVTALVLMSIAIAILPFSDPDAGH